MWNNGVNTVHGLAWRPRLKIWKSRNNTFDPKTFKAYSYGHWCYFRKINGKNVFNAYYYSQATSTHQSELREVLKKLKIKIHYTVYLSSSLTEENLKEELRNLYFKHFKNIRALTRPRIRAKKIAALNSDSEDILKRIKQIEKITKSKVSNAEIGRIKKQSFEESDLQYKNNLVLRAEERDEQRALRQEKQDLLNNSFVNV